MSQEINNIIKFAQANHMIVNGVDPVTNAISIDGQKFIPITDVSKLFKADMTLVVNDLVKADARGENADYVFEFGGTYYWSPRDSSKVEFNDFRYIGKAAQSLPQGSGHLGIHGGYEILNGTGSYDKWCDKAAFLGHRVLGICEKNTLSGAIAFQLSCKDHGIKPVIGMSVDVSEESWSSTLKLYATNYQGWRNILRIHKYINVTLEEGEDKTVPLDKVLRNSYGVGIVIGWGSDVTPVVNKFLSSKAEVYYQIDTIVYDDVANEIAMLNNVKVYIEEYLGIIPPMLVNDTYYIDEDYKHIKVTLNKTSGQFQKRVSNAHYKTGDETFKSLCDLFKDDDERVFDIYQMAVDNLSAYVDKVDFVIETGVAKMPEFKCDEVDPPFAGYKSNEDLIWAVLEDGLKTVVGDVPNIEEYIDRMVMEMEVIKRGGFIDYFLVMWDIIKWSADNGIYTGLGRGSAGGSMVAYLMGITKIDPLTYNLPFERFMNEGRLIGSLPDIDSDFEGLRRNDVKRYMESKYGIHMVCSIGSYSKLRVKAAMNELWLDKSKTGTIRYMTSMIQNRDGDWDEIFKSAQKKRDLKEFVLKNVDFINDVRLVLDQPKNPSIHAGAVVVVPKEDRDGKPMDIYDWMPVTKRDGVLVSEWEGAYIEKCGFLKNDILGTRQMDKFRYITDLIKATTGQDVSIYDIPTDDAQVFAMFREGYTEDTFHFGTGGLKAYTRLLKPENVDDLIDTISLHRPALMDIGMHKEFVNRRFGKSRTAHDPMLEEITKSTNGILIYQEQVMEAVKHVGGFTMQEADDVRRAMGKKKIEVIKPYKDQFVAGAIERGLTEKEAHALWDKLELFSGYGFNRAHATAYALTGYIGMWFKVHYPLQFWTAAFEYASDEDIPKYVSEMRHTGTVKIAPPDINESDGAFTTNYEKNTIHWSLAKIKQVGGVATDEIVEERKENGRFYDLEELFRRVTRKKVNRKVITSLIYAGCLDALHGVNKPSDRKAIFKMYADLIGEPVYDMIDTEMIHEEYWWVAMQKIVSGIGEFDFKDIAMSRKMKVNDAWPYTEAVKIQDPDSEGRRVTVGGLVTKVDPHKSGKGEVFANIDIDSNDEIMRVTIWPDYWEKVKGEIENRDTRIIIIMSGIVKYSSFMNANVVETIKGSQVTVVDTNIVWKLKS